MAFVTRGEKNILEVENILGRLAVFQMFQC